MPDPACHPRTLGLCGDPGLLRARQVCRRLEHAARVAGLALSRSTEPRSRHPIGPRKKMQQLGLDLKQHTPEILRLWAEVLSEPPLRLPPGHDPGELPEVIYDLIEVSLLRPHDRSAHEAKIADAVRHGERRKQEGAGESFIFEEFAALREAIRRYLESCPVPKWKRREALMRLDMALSVAELAAIRGYYRPAFERAGLWDTLLAQLARTSPLLGLPEPSQSAVDAVIGSPLARSREPFEQRSTPD
jgi:hypothetical protein